MTVENESAGVKCNGCNGDSLTQLLYLGRNSVFSFQFFAVYTI